MTSLDFLLFFTKKKKKTGNIRRPFLFFREIPTLSKKIFVGTNNIFSTMRLYQRILLNLSYLPYNFFHLQTTWWWNRRTVMMDFGRYHHYPKLFRIPDFWPKQNVYVCYVRGYSMYLGMWHTCICKFKKSKFVNKIFKFRSARRVLGGNYTGRVVYIIHTFFFARLVYIFRRLTAKFQPNWCRQCWDMNFFYLYILPKTLNSIFSEVHFSNFALYKLVLQVLSSNMPCIFLEQADMGAYYPILRKTQNSFFRHR